MSDNKFLKIPEIIEKVKEQSKNLEDGKLTIEQLNDLLELSRQLNERIAILRYKALTSKNSPVIDETPKITKEQIFNEIATNKKEEKPVEVQEEKTDDEDAGFTLDFGKIEEEQPPVKPEENSSQRNLIDQINEDESKQLSVNERLAAEKKESVAEKLQHTKIDDLRTVIGINQKFLFMNDLFEGEKAHYDTTIDKINSLDSKSDVIQYIDNEISSKFNWDNTNESVQAFKALIDRKFA